MLTFSIIILTLNLCFSVVSVCEEVNRLTGRTPLKLVLSLGWVSVVTLAWYYVLVLLTTNPAIK